LCRKMRQQLNQCCEPGPTRASPHVHPFRLPSRVGVLLTLAWGFCSASTFLLPAISEGRETEVPRDRGSSCVGSRTILFSGYEWNVRKSDEPETPDYNYFSDSSDNAWVDSTDRLHLRITQRDSQWYCAEVVIRPALGHGMYIFQVGSRIGELDENVVLGLFHYDYGSGDPFHREMDIEFSRWGYEYGPNAQFVVQPWEVEGNLYRWNLPGETEFSTHCYNWTTDSIRFVSAKGYQVSPPFDSIIDQWTYRERDRIPQPGSERVRLNFWLSLARAPSDSVEPEVIINSFKHIPEPWVRRRAGTFLPQHRLTQNLPNPFCNTTSFRYELKNDEDVTVEVYNASGRSIRTLVKERKRMGSHGFSWDGRDDVGNEVGSGIYFCRMEAGQVTTTIQMVFVR
jgi:hypothetical protein